MCSSLVLSRYTEKGTDWWNGNTLGMLVLTVLKSRSLTADIVQEAFIRIWENHLVVNPDLSFKSFVFTIANNLIVSEYRKQINRPELMEYLDFTNSIELTDDPVSAKIDFDEFMERLTKAKLLLPPRQREIFEPFFLDNPINTYYICIGVESIGSQSLYKTKSFFVFLSIIIKRYFHIHQK